MKRLLPTGVAMALASAAYAQQPPPSPPAPPTPTAAEAAEPEDDIVVLAEPGDQVRIDRRTYALRDDPVAQSTSMFDILGRIPSVSVAPSGEITLLGASNVTVQINGQPIPGGNLEQILRGLPGGSVERIEVITNPSAQYAADTSGGIINIITRRRFNAGFNGSIQASADSLGGYHFGVAPSYSAGPWSFSGQAGTYGGGGENNLLRERQTPPGGPLTTEDGLRNFEYQGWYLSQLQAAYSPTEQRRMSLSYDGGQHSSEQRQSSETSNSGGPISTTQSRFENTNSNSGLTFDFQQRGDTPRELIKFNASWDRFINESDALLSVTPAGGSTSAYATISEQHSTSFNAKLDVEQPLPSEQFLTWGASFDNLEQTSDNALSPISGVTPGAYFTRLEGSAQTLAGYTTYQFDVGAWTLLPGVRAEAYRREVLSGGLETDGDDVRVFPSIHLRNELAPRFNVDLSYSSRIQRPGFDQLNPALRFIDVNRAMSGNPNLEPTTTDAYEANFVYQHNGASFSVTFFDRISEDVVSRFTDVNGSGVIVTMPVNAGTSEQRGVQAMFRDSLGEHWRYSLTGNVLNREYDFLSGGLTTRRSELEYDGVAQIDYRESDQEQVGANQFQLEARFQGPRHGLQSETDEFVVVNFTWRRRLSSRLFAVLAVQDIFDSASQVSEITTDDYFEHTEFESAGTRVRLALTYQFGDGPQRPMQEQPGPPPIPMQQ